MKQLEEMLNQLDGKSYKGYKSTQGTYRFHNYTLMIDYVQGDPFAAPSRIRISIPFEKRNIKKEWQETRTRKIYAEDAIARKAAEEISRLNYRIKGSGKSGIIAIDAPGQEILKRTAVELKKKETVLCFSIGLPANGRRINGKEAHKLFFRAIPRIIEQSFFNLNDARLEEAAKLADQHDTIKAELKKNDWVAFVANGAILPRKSGISDKPMKGAVPFHSPAENEVSISLPHREEPLAGMAIKRGITLIVGGGYHGKSTLLQAIERGVYPHIQGDGREYVLTDDTAMKVRAEDGRQVTNVNISPFINQLPHGQDTSQFTTENASGSTSQAANVMEALEAGAVTLLIDEDTSATNFMIRDTRMQELVAKEKEPITPFIDKVKQMNDQLDISTILVMGGSGDYFDVADQVILMDHYLPYDVTAEAKAIADKYPTDREKEGGEEFGKVPERAFLSNTIQAQAGKRLKVQAKGKHLILMGKSEILLPDVEQLVDASQTRMIAEIIRFVDQKKLLQSDLSFSELLDRLEKQIEEAGLGSFTPFPNQHPGDLAKPRRLEVAAAFNRLRTAVVKDLS